MHEIAPVVEIQNASFAYGPDNLALDAIGLEIRPGERLALVGHNGSGKSTLARLLNGLLTPVQGRVLVSGIDSKTLPASKLAAHVALAFQHPDDQICQSTIEREVRFGPRNLGFASDKVLTLADRALAHFGLVQEARKNPHDLGYSGRKRLALASVFAMDSPVLVLDEPTAGLDAREIDMLVHTLDLPENKEKAVLVITHDMDFLAENLDRLVCLCQGKKVFDGRTRDFFARPEHMTSAGLLPPQMVRLSRHFNLNAPAMTPDEFVASLETFREEA